jgi:hypothetical protein
MAAVLACGRDALRSHPSGAALLDLLPTSSAFIHVTVSGHAGRQRRRRGLVVHCSRWIYSDDRTIVAFERERERDIALQLAGVRVIRITERRLRERPNAVVSDLERLLAIHGHYRAGHG